jgi:hypothetical protein
MREISSVPNAAIWDVQLHEKVPTTGTFIGNSGNSLTKGVNKVYYQFFYKFDVNVSD